MIAHSHNSSTPGLLRNILHRLNKPRILHYATDFFACSKVAGKWLFDEKTMRSDRFHIIHNALHVEKFFTMKRSDKRSEKNLVWRIGL